MKFHSFFIAALLISKAVSLHAAEISPEKELSEEDYLGSMPTVLTVSRLAQPLEASPSAVTIIDRETIRASGVVDLTDIFRLVPGMYVGHNAGYFHSVNPAVSYHGMTDAYSRRMQVLIDGRSVYSPLFGGIQWSDIPLAIEDIARIEITRGPNSASHGANSFLGVINIITLHSSETLGNMVVATSGGDRKGITYRHGGKIGDMNYRLTAGINHDDGIQRRVDDKRIHMLNFRADYRLNDRDELEFQFGYNGGDREEGELSEDAQVYLPRTKQVTSHFQQLNWRRTLGSDSEFKLQAYHAYDKSDDHIVSIDLSSILPAPFLPFLVTPKLNFNHDVTTERYDIEAQHTFAPTANTRVAWGGSLRLDRAESPLFLDENDNSRFHLSRVFGHLEWSPIQQLTINAGSMLENNSFTGTDITPRVSANLHLAPGHTLRAGISTATRTPTLLEEKFDWKLQMPTTHPVFSMLYQQNILDEGGLSPERITSRELGYLGIFKSFMIDLRLFHDRIDEIIHGYTTSIPPAPPGFLSLSGTASSYHNSSKLTIHGFEAQAQWRPTERSRVIANYSHIRINPDMRYAFSNSGEADRFEEFGTSMPIDSFSLLAWHRFESGWMGSLGYYQSGETKMPGDGNHVDFARHWDARIARSFKTGTVSHEISITAQNAFSQDYEEFARYNTLDRRTSLQYRLDF
jgi:iron complex outermembrane receptor protein